MRPRLPSLIRSESETPWFWYFLATETTKRRLERTSLSSASWSPARMRRARSDLVLARDQRILADVAQVLVERAFVVARRACARGDAVAPWRRVASGPGAGWPRASRRTVSREVTRAGPTGSSDRVRRRDLSGCALRAAAIGRRVSHGAVRRRVRRVAVVHDHRLYRARASRGRSPSSGCRASCRDCRRARRSVPSGTTSGPQLLRDG